MDRSPDYDRYIRSDGWKGRRATFLQTQGKKCRGCGLTGIMEVHHRTYARMGAETDGDLIVLCSECHKGVHELHRTMAFTTLSVATDLYVQHMASALAKALPRRKRKQRM